MRPYRPPFILALTLCVFSLNARAGTQNATITGSVYASGAGLAGATVHLINAGIGFSQTQITGSDGTYIFNSVPPAENYLISVEHGGFVPNPQGLHRQRPDCEAALDLTEARVEHVAPGGDEPPGRTRRSFRRPPRSTRHWSSSCWAAWKMPSCLPADSR